MIVIWSYYLTYSMVLDLPSISKEEITKFFGLNIYNVETSEDRIIKKGNEYKIIKKLKSDEYPEKLKKEINNELNKY